MPRVAQSSPNSHLADLLPTVPSTTDVTKESSQYVKGSLTSLGANRMAPLSGKKIFMHYEPGTTADRYLENVLRKLKADLVDFFSRDVHYVISNRPQSRIPPLGSSPTLLNTTDSPNSTQGVSSNSPALKQPSMPNWKLSATTVTRGRAMLMAARRNTAPTSTISPQESKPSTILRQIQPTNSGLSIVSPRASVDGPLHSTQEVAETSPRDAVFQSNDLLARARRLGIRILTVESVFKWIRNLPSDVQAFIKSAENADSEGSASELPDDPERDRLCQVRHLTTPCIKILDVSGQTRPLYMDRTDYLPGLWNLLSRRAAKVKDTPGDLNTNVGSGSVPAASLGRTGVLASQSHPVTGANPSVLSRQNSRKKRKERLNKHHTAVQLAQPLKRSASIPGKMGCSPDTRSKAAVEDEPSGYCECCSMAFRNLFEHLKCPEHQQFAGNSENYHLLDNVLNRLPSLGDFLASEAAKQKVVSSERRPAPHKKRHRSGTKSTSGETKSPRKVENKNGEHLLQDISVTPQPLDVAEPDKSPVPESMVPPLLNLTKVTERSVINEAEPVKLFSDDEEEVEGDDFVSAVAKEAVDPVIPVSGTPAASFMTQGVQNFTTVQAAIVSSILTREELASVDLDDEREQLPVLPVNPTEPPPTPSLMHNIEAWRSVCSNLYVSDAFRQPVAQPDWQSTLGESPILERVHLPCGLCSRSHIPARLPTAVHLKVNSLLGPSYSLDGFGCQGNSISNCESPILNAIHSRQEEEDKSEQNHLSTEHPDTPTTGTAFAVPFPEAAVGSTSPVFDGKDVETVHQQKDGTPSTSPMCHRSADTTVKTLDSSSPQSIHHSPLEADISSPSSLSRRMVSTPRISPDKNSSTTMNSCSLPCGSPTIRSDTETERQKSLSWLLNSASFEARLPHDIPSFCSGKKSEKAIKRRRHKSSHSLSDSTVLRQLPVLKRTRMSRNKPLDSVQQESLRSSSRLSEKSTVTLDISGKKRKKKTCDAPPYVTPMRSVTPRIAARVARESISLSVRALYSPSALNRFSDELRHSNISPNDSKLVTPPKQRPLISQDVASPTSADVANPQHLRKRRRILFSPDSSEDEFFDSPISRSKMYAKKRHSPSRMRLFNPTPDTGR